MKNHFREMAGLSAIFIALALFLVSFGTVRGQDDPNGKKLFEAKCAQCHGKDAKGVAKMAKVLKVEPAVVDLTKAQSVTLSSEDMVKQVTNGKKKMPKYKGKLTEDQIKAVVAYLKTLQGGGKK